MQTIAAVYFSPTDNTRKIVHAMLPSGREFEILRLDVTTPKKREAVYQTLHQLENRPDLWIFGSPVYSGQLPGIFKEILAGLQGAGQPAAGVVTYGNRSYGIAPSQIRDILSQNGFNVIALGAFVGEHAYSEKFHVGMQRPDRLDIQRAGQFGQKMLNPGMNHHPQLSFKGHIDVVARLMPEGGPKPFVDAGLCRDCRICVTHCPVNAIDPGTKSFLDDRTRKKCISCMSCVKRCPAKARSYRIPSLLQFLLDRFYFKAAKTTYREPITVAS